MRIGVDIDGVLTNLETFLVEYGTKYYSEKGIEYTINPTGYDIGELFGVGKEGEKEFWSEHVEAYAKNEWPRHFAVEVMNRLKADGYELYIITARLWSYEDSERGGWMRGLVYDWFRRHGLPYDELIFTHEDKLQRCRENGIELMIEDKPQNIMDISEELPVIAFDARYNQKCEGEKIMRCYSWYDVYRTIRKWRERTA